MAKSLQIIIDPNFKSDYDEKMIIAIRSYWTEKIGDIPREVRRARRGIRWLEQKTGVDYHRIRRTLQFLKLEPNK